MSDTTLKPNFDVAAVRAEFPILHHPLPKGRPLVYLDSGATAQKPRCVIDAERDCYEATYANAYRGVYYLGNQVDEALEATRETVRDFIGAASSEEIVFTSGTTAAINIVAFGWGRKHVNPGDDVLINEMEHHANFVPWQQLAKERGARLRFIPLTEEGRLDLDSLDELLTEKTRIVAVSGMSNVLGTINPIEEIAARAKAVGAAVLVDGAQSVPHMRTDVGASGVDFLAFSGHKLYGPSGIGILYGRKEMLEQTEPLLFGGHMIDSVTKEESTWMPPPARFEAGTIPIAQAIALKAAVDYVASFGWEAIHAHEQSLVNDALERLPRVAGLKLLGPADPHRGSIFSFVLDGANPQDIALLLDRKGIAVRSGHHCTMPLHEHLGIPASTRASLGIYNMTGEIDALVEGLQFVRERLRL